MNVALTDNLQKPNLILNVDGVIAVSFVDLLRHSGAFSAYVSHTPTIASCCIDHGSIANLPFAAVRRLRSI